MLRTAKIERKTKETKICLELALDGNGTFEINTKIGFFNHMLELLATHSGFDLKVNCEGDTDVDFHHSVEDIGICLGKAFNSALGDKKGIARFSSRILPMDESVCMIALDISGRPYLNFENNLKGKVGEFDMELVEEFLRAFVINAGINLYVNVLKAGNYHHIAEVIFKGLAKVLQDGVKIVSEKIPSSKGII